jgi:hypothetical protein
MESMTDSYFREEDEVEWPSGRALIACAVMFVPMVLAIGIAVAVSAVVRGKK